MGKEFEETVYKRRFSPITRAHEEVTWRSNERPEKEDEVALDPTKKAGKLAKHVLTTVWGRQTSQARADA